MKKIFILVCFIFMTGCSARYTIEFNDDIINDNLVVFGVNNVEYEAIKNDKFAPIQAFNNALINLEEPVKNEGVEYYDLRAHDGNAYLDYSFDLSDYGDSYFANLCYDYFKVFEEESDIVFSTGKEFKCFFPGYGLDSVDVVIKTNHEVFFSNADSVDGDSYIWHITPDNVNEANIQISFSKESKQSLLNKAFSNYIIVGCLVALVFVFIGFIVYINNKRVNKI